MSRSLDYTIVTGNPFLDVDLDAAPLYVDARTEGEFDVALMRDRDVDPLRASAWRSLNIGSWLTSVDRRWPARIVFPTDALA